MYHMGNNFQIMLIFKPGVRWLECAWFIEIAFVREVGKCVCVHACVSAPKAINYIHVIFNLYNQLNKFVAVRNIKKAFYTWAFVTKLVVTETNLIRLC